MSEQIENKGICVVIGASQAGVTLAFALRDEGWEGDIVLYDADLRLPYARPPLSKAVLTGKEDLAEHVLKPSHLYEKEKITLRLGCRVASINRHEKQVVLTGGNKQPYDKLVLATGSRPIVPGIPGLDRAANVFSVRTADDVINIHRALDESKDRQVVIIGGGYIGLETAASLKKMGASVTVIEREERVLARVTSPEMSNFFQELHAKNGVQVLTGKTVASVEARNNRNVLICNDGSVFQADIIIVGVGVYVNTELADDAGLAIENGIKVDSSACTSDKAIYAIGDCTNHYNPFYDRYVRLESVQNASDQAKVAAAAICGKKQAYEALPWFWSDQYDVKLQIVGLSQGYNNLVVRKEEGDVQKFSVWYFKDDRLLAVDAVNNIKAYVMGTKFIKSGNMVDKARLSDSGIEFKPANLLVE